jgi:hypothetical protein
VDLISDRARVRTVAMPNVVAVTDHDRGVFAVEGRSRARPRRTMGSASVSDSSMNTPRSWAVSHGGMKLWLPDLPTLVPKRPG